MAKALSFKELTGAQKTAIFLLAMGEGYIEQTFAKMDDVDVRGISLAMAGLGVVPAKLVEQVLEDFTAQARGPAGVMGTMQGTERLLEKVLPEARQKDILPTASTTWGKLEQVDARLLADYLKNEYPQTVAVVMAKLSPGFAAKVMALLPENIAMDVVMRMMRLEGVDSDLIMTIEETLKADLVDRLSPLAGQDSILRVVEMFNQMDRTSEDRLMTALFDRNREVAAGIRSLMFTFEDLIRLDHRSLAIVVKLAGTRPLALALKGASTELKDALISKMPALRKEMDQLGAVRLKDVDAAQQTIVGLAKDLAKQGEIKMPDGAPQDVMIE